MPPRKKTRVSKPMLPRYRLKEYSETIEFRDNISNLLGTSYRFLAVGHWVMTTPELHDTFEERVQDWNRNERVMDTNCSLYCLYNELRYAYNRKFPKMVQIPELFASAHGYRHEMVANRSLNLALLKEHLPKLTQMGRWDVPLEWRYTHSEPKLKADYLLAIRLYRPY